MVVLGKGCCSFLVEGDERGGSLLGRREGSVRMSAVRER